MLSPAKALADELSKNRTLLINEVLTAPDFSTFWHLSRKYSLHNQALLYAQLKRRSIPIGQVNSFNAWKDLGNPVAPKQQAVYVMAPKEKEEPSTKDPGSVVSKIYFNLTPVFALAQTQTPEMLFTVPALPSIDLSRYNRTGTLNSVEDWFSFVHSLVSSTDPMEGIITSLLVVSAFAGPHLQQSVTLRPYLEAALKHPLQKEAKVFQEAQQILRSLFG